MSKEQEKLVVKIDFDKMIIQVIADENDMSFCSLCPFKNDCQNNCLIYCG